MIFWIFLPANCRKKKPQKSKKGAPLRATHTVEGHIIARFCFNQNTPNSQKICTQTTRHPRRPKLAAARSAAASSVRRLCQVVPFTVFCFAILTQRQAPHGDLHGYASFVENRGNRMGMRFPMGFLKILLSSDSQQFPVVMSWLGCPRSCCGMPSPSSRQSHWLHKVSAT